jgi:hypothetical protein
VSAQNFVTKSRQPVHTVFGGAHLFRADVVDRFRSLAVASLDTYAGDPDEFGAVFGAESAEHAERVYNRVYEKLLREPIEDYRIDFEDGYGIRPTAEEDGHAEVAGREVAAAIAARSLPWRLGIRVKSFAAGERARSEQTLRLFLATVVERAGGVPPNFVVNLPKVTSVGQVADFARLLDECEREFRLPARAIGLEVMVESPEIVLGADGGSPLPRLIEAGGARVSGAIFGAYDFTAALGITAAHQSLRHPACDFARNMMLVAFAGSEVRLSDGATAILPVPVHTAAQGSTLTAVQRQENRRSVHAAWRAHYDNIRHAMAGGFYQGWDLHPAQLVSRYAATFAFFIESLDAAGTRLKNFVAKSAQATRVGAAFDDAATGRGLVNYFLRAVGSGAITEEEAAERSGMTISAMRGLEF